ncbi:hypothetical protein QQP08_004232 [Theobroma cacao]|nr:hypothetical protein QQP08_004232 [Theobroma cacao]
MQVLFCERLIVLRLFFNVDRKEGHFHTADSEDNNFPYFVVQASSVLISRVNDSIEFLRTAAELFGLKQLLKSTRQRASSYRWFFKSTIPSQCSCDVQPKKNVHVLKAEYAYHISFSVHHSFVVDLPGTL